MKNRGVTLIITRGSAIPKKYPHSILNKSQLRRNFKCDIT